LPSPTNLDISGIRSAIVWIVAKEDIKLKLPYKAKGPHAIKELKKRRYYEETINRGHALMAMVKNGKLYTLLDSINIPREKVRVTEYVKETRKQVGGSDTKKVKKVKKKLLG
jgi:hypothetical protein